MLTIHNVLGAFSSGCPKSEDFRIVLEEIARIKCGPIHVPRPDAGRWEPAGRIILGTVFSLAWRVFDAELCEASHNCAAIPCVEFIMKSLNEVASLGM